MAAISQHGVKIFHSTRRAIDVWQNVISDHDIKLRRIGCCAQIVFRITDAAVGIKTNRFVPDALAGNFQGIQCLWRLRMQKRKAFPIFHDPRPMRAVPTPAAYKPGHQGLFLHPVRLFHANKYPAIRSPSPEDRPAPRFRRRHGQVYQSRSGQLPGPAHFISFFDQRRKSVKHRPNLPLFVFRCQTPQPR